MTPDHQSKAMAGWGMASTGSLQVSSRAAGQVVHKAEEFRFGPDGVGEKVVVRQGPVLEYGSRVLPDRASEPSAIMPVRSCVQYRSYGVYPLPFQSM